MKSSSSAFRLPPIFQVLLGCWASFFSGEVLAQKDPNLSQLYFPPTGSSVWEEMQPAELGWDQTALAEFLAWLPTQDTRAFLILKDGKLVVEEYWGPRLTGMGQMDEGSFWYWGSAGKTLTAALVGIAQGEKLLSIKDRTQDYLGAGWTSMSPKQERDIRIVHHLSMTTGLNDRLANPDDPSAAALSYYAKPGTRWSYHNASYTILEKVLAKATGKDYQAYFAEKIGSILGMKGFWQKSGFNFVYYSDARSFARFGLLMLAGGNWNGTQVGPADFFAQMGKSSQALNPSYGYLTWLNGKSSYLLPGSQKAVEGTFIPSGPSDMYQAMGENGQFLVVIPSQNLVIVRMGGAPGDLPVPYLLARQLWDRLDKVIR